MVVIRSLAPDVLAAISHPARRRMPDHLINTACSVNGRAGHLQMSRPAVSQHLRVRLDAGLVTEQRHGRERRYRLAPAQLRPARDWMAYDERFWDEHLVDEARSFDGRARLLPSREAWRFGRSLAPLLS